MGTQRTSVSIIDRVDGQPAMILANGNWGQWSNEQKKYIDTGAKAIPEDDANSIKYFKLTNTSETPTAPTKSGGWPSIEQLDAALKAQGWQKDPQSVSDTNRFQWMAVYTKEQLPTADGESGIIKFSPRFSFSVVGLYNNFAPAPTITFDEGRQTIIITNPDGTSNQVKIPTPESVKALGDLIAGIKKQVDKAIYSYEGADVPTMDGPVVKEWLKGDDGSPITDDATKAGVFSTHLGDIYVDKQNDHVYRFALTEGGNPDRPSDYEWKISKDGAATSALAKIADLAGDTVKIWTETPSNGDSYKVGDLLLYKDSEGGYRYKHCIKANTPPQYTYTATDWVEPYATLKEVEAIQEKIRTLSADLETAKGNITDLQNETENIKGEWIDAIRDGIISEQEKARLDTIQKQLDTEQAQLQSNVDYILNSDYFTDKDTFRNTANAVLAKTTGTLDKLQQAIKEAIADNAINQQEIAKVNAAFDAYNESVKVLSAAIRDAKTEIDKKIQDNIQIGGRNLILNSADVRKIVTPSDDYLIASFPLNLDSVKEGDDITLSMDVEVYKDYTASLWLRKFDVLKLATGKNERYIYSKVFKVTSDILEVGSIDIYNVFYDSSLEDRRKNKVNISYIKLERGNKATDYSIAPEDIQAQIDEINAHPPRVNPETKNWEVYRFVEGVGKYVDTGDTSVGDDGKAPKIVDGYWHVWDGTAYVSSGQKAIGEDGQGGLSVRLERQGEFRTTYRVVSASGQILPTPQAVKTVVGGVDGKVVVRAIITKGVKDVTAVAKNNGGAFKWLLNGTQVASGTEVLELGVGDHVDGNNDNISFEFNDTKAKEW